MNDETRISPPHTAPRAPTDATRPGSDTARASEPQAETFAQTPEVVARVQALVPGAAVVVRGYDILGELGRGGMGVVYKARQVALNRVVALKMILAAGHADAREIARFVAEATAMAAVRHPNVIQVFDSGEADGRPFMAMEFLEGGSLVERLRAVGKLPPRAAAELVQKVARGVQAAHDRGIVHRDLKPHNVLLDLPPADSPDGTWGEPKVMDFGLAKRDGAELTQTGAVMGTPAYMAPEQARGEARAIGRPTDVYALGVILYECLCGSVPFRGSDAWSVIRQVVSDEPEPVARRAADVPRELDLICRKCLEKEPADRYGSAGSLADDLNRFLNGEAPIGPKTGAWYGARRAVRRWWRPLAAGAALVTLFVIAWLLPSPFGPPPPAPERPEDKKGAGLEALRKEVVAEVEALRLEQPHPDHEAPHPLDRRAELPPTDYSKFKVFEEYCVVDLRGWKALSPNDPRAECSVVSTTRREVTKLAPTNELRIETRTTGRDVVNRAEHPNRGRARALATDRPEFAGGPPVKVRQLVFDVANIPTNQKFALRYTSTYWNALQAPGEQWFDVTCADSAKTSMLVLFPDGRPFRDYQLKFAPVPTTDSTKLDPQPYTGPLITFAADDKSWLYWEIAAPQANTVYRVDWTW